MTDDKQSHGSAQPGHEPDLVNVSRVVVTSAGLVLLVLAALGLMSVLLLVLNREVANSEPTNLLTLPPPATVGPRLNPNQPGELHALCAAGDDPQQLRLGRPGPRNCPDSNRACDGGAGRERIDTGAKQRETTRCKQAQQIELAILALATAGSGYGRRGC